MVFPCFGDPLARRYFTLVLCKTLILTQFTLLLQVQISADETFLFFVCFSHYRGVTLLTILSQAMTLNLTLREKVIFLYCAAHDTTMKNPGVHSHNGKSLPIIKPTIFPVQKAHVPMDTAAWHRKSVFMFINQNTFDLGCQNTQLKVT